MPMWMIERALIASALAGGFLPFERTLFGPEGEGTGGGGGAPAGGGEGGNTPPPADAPKYTDKQLNDLIAKNVAKEVAKAKSEAEAAQKTLAAELEAARNEAALAGKSAEEKAKLIAESDAKKRASEQERIAKELGETKARADRAEAALRHRIVSGSAQSALIEAKVLPAMAGDALDLFMLKAQVELDEDGATVKSITVDGAYHKTMKDAAEAFLRSRPGFTPAPAGGSGTPRLGGGMNSARRLEDMSEEELWALPSPKR